VHRSGVAVTSAAANKVGETAADAWDVAEGAARTSPRNADSFWARTGEHVLAGGRGAIAAFEVGVEELVTQPAEGLGRHLPLDNPVADALGGAAALWVTRRTLRAGKRAVYVGTHMQQLSEVESDRQQGRGLEARIRLLKPRAVDILSVQKQVTEHPGQVTIGVFNRTDAQLAVCGSLTVETNRGLERISFEGKLDARSRDGLPLQYEGRSTGPVPVMPGELTNRTLQLESTQVFTTPELQSLVEGMPRHIAVEYTDAGAARAVHVDGQTIPYAATTLNGMHAS
jgi:hypothetical protein